MKDSVFVDTNVFIYAYSGTEPEKKEKALIILKRKDIVISTQVINEFIWNMNKKFHVDIKLLKNLIDILFQKFRVGLIERATIIQAFDTVKQYKYSYWDSLIIASALENNCTILFSEDMQHNQVIENKLKIISPFEEVNY